ncbi:MAG: hypothetical protein Q8P81_03455 [Nanoarchaeota archaeon]|nr:hypothetical protein [Nanoarchaeota archaeon]
MNNIINEKQKITDLKELIRDLYKFINEKLNYNPSLKIILQHDSKNAKDNFGKTAYYDSDNKKIVLYITNRHNKDICRSFAHECIHVFQDHNGKMKDKQFTAEENYFSENKYMRELEREAFEQGNMIFREWQESKKSNKSE